MSVDYSWVITKVSYASNENNSGGHGDKKNIVNFVYCILLAKDTESNTKEFRSFKIPIIYNPNDTFIEYENLQQSDVEKWIEEYLTTDTVNTIKAQIESNFTKMKTNPIVVNIPPWQTANTAYNGAWPPTIDDVDIL